MDYDGFFAECTGFSPRPWQRRLAESPDCTNRLIRIPTGLGKTSGVAAAWAFHRVQRADLWWPTRLVWVLPMRTLVEQTLAAIEQLRDRSGLGFEVVPCMGGLVHKEYAVHPETPTVLVGTQDMLVSRMLNRGYAAARGRWPVDFGLLSRDALVVCDEVQLMDASLPTTAQLASFRTRRRAIRPSATWWMSATLQEDWLRTVDHADAVDALLRVDVPPEEQRGTVWETHKPLVLEPDLQDEKALAESVKQAHEPGTLTLVIVNRVERAVAVHKRLRGTAADLRLVHSRFRPAERAEWLESFLCRDAELPEHGRIIVATQVVEAGVDISARRLFTDLAPWPSLVQRFGRAGRYAGEHADIVVCGNTPGDEKKSAPYTRGELESAQGALETLVAQDSGVALRELEALERSISPTERAELYPLPATPVLREQDLTDLFDTTPDLSGADLDIAPFVRSTDARNVSIFWRDVDEMGPHPGAYPRREELCSCPVARARDWLRKLPAGSWWLLDFGRGWERGTASKLRSLAPGRLVWIVSSAGGYRPEAGWDPKSKRSVPEVPDALGGNEAAFERSAAIEGSEALSEASSWRTVATHCSEAAEHVRRISTSLKVPQETTLLLTLAARWHDLGKAHPVFQDCITEEGRTALAKPTRQDLAKAPRHAWTRARRRGFRHELASALGLLAVLRRADPQHPALRGAVADVLEALDLPGTPILTDLADHPMARELRALTAAQVDLVLWLVATHHGKVRSSLVSTPNDQRDMRHVETTTVQVHGVRDGDRIPPTKAAGPDGAVELPELKLDLAISQVGLDPDFGRSWTERAERLLDLHGPFELAWLEAVMRAADVQASQRTDPDPEVTS